MTDQFLYDETLESQPKVTPFVDKNMFYVQDQNGGTYNGQILFDTSVLSNSGQWLAYSESYIQIPFFMTFQSSTDVSAAKCTRSRICNGIEKWLFPADR
jgi:hypothetical protein